jgi:modulator of FtsH protease HflK
VNVAPQPARAPENVQDAFDDAIKAQEDEKRFKEQAQAYKARVVPIAEGNAQRIYAEAKAYAEQVVLRASGEIAEFAALLPAYTQNPQVTGERMYLDTMQQILSKTSKIVVDSKASNVLYLPLDKLISAAPESLLTKIKANNHSANENGNNNGLFDGREVTRPTERLGRTN